MKMLNSIGPCGKLLLFRYKISKMWAEGLQNSPVDLVVCLILKELSGSCNKLFPDGKYFFIYIQIKVEDKILTRIF